jgi:hypothetical protein
MRPVPVDVFYVEAPTVPVGMTLDAYRRSRALPQHRRGLLRLLVSWASLPSRAYDRFAADRDGECGGLPNWKPATSPAAPLRAATALAGGLA